MNDDLARTLIKIPGVGYAVASRSKLGYFVLVEGKDCSCPAGVAKTCRHRKLVADLCRVQDLKRRRPSAPPNVSAMCD